MFRCLLWDSTTRWLRCCAILLAAAAPTFARAQYQAQPLYQPQPQYQPQDQDRTMQDRLDRVERDLNMLQRQVYRGAPAMAAPGGGAGGSPAAADLEVRMEQVEQQMRDLTGRVEQIANGLDQLKQRVEQINSDFGVRFDQLSGGGSGPATVSGPPPRPGPDARIAGGPPPGTVVPAPSSGGGGLGPIFNTLSPPGTAPSRPPPPPTAGPASAEPPGVGSTTEQFNHAFGLLKQSDYTGAEAALRAFIETHPNDPLAGNAQYWLGQTYYARNKYPEAAAAFAEGYKRFPKGPKAADSLLYLSMSLARSDQKKNACLTLEQLDQSFPNSAPAVHQRAAAEKKRIGCS
jgi:tol-pal system protein YbgF